MANKGIRAKDWVGKKFWKLKVIKLGGYYTNKERHRWRKVQVQCKCGNRFYIVPSKLRRGMAKTCRECANKNKRIVKPGDRFDMVVVIKYIKRGKRTGVLCRCDCGTEYLMRPEVLKINKTNNCGCSRRGHWQGVGDLSKTFYYRIKRNAKVRNMKFNISMKTLWQLYQKQKGKCALSGLPIVFSRKTAKASTASLDRKNSKLGYTIRNIQWVHKDVNKMKMEYSYTYFLYLCKQVCQYSKKVKE